MLREDGIYKACPLFAKKQKKAMHQNSLIETTTQAKCQKQLDDTVVGKERGNLLFNGL